MTSSTAMGVEKHTGAHFRLTFTHEGSPQVLLARPGEYLPPCASFPRTSTPWLAHGCRLIFRSLLSSKIMRQKNGANASSSSMDSGQHCGVFRLKIRASAPGQVKRASVIQGYARAGDRKKSERQKPVAESGASFVKSWVRKMPSSRGMVTPEDLLSGCCLKTRTVMRKAQKDHRAVGYNHRRASSAYSQIMPMQKARPARISSSRAWTFATGAGGKTAPVNEAEKLGKRQERG